MAERRDGCRCAGDPVFPEEARSRSEILNDRLGPSTFDLPWMNARADLLGVSLLMGDFAAIDRTWPALWEDAVSSEASERWLTSGRLAPSCRSG